MRRGNRTISICLGALLSCAASVGVARADGSPYSLTLNPPQTSDAPPAKPVDKSGYNLFHPTPRALMREFQTDRPDQTEGPFTVDAGHLQIESDLANYTYDRRQPDHSPVTSQTLLAGDSNFRLGLLDNLEFNLIVFPYLWQRDEDRVSRTGNERGGFGDTTLRLKLNILGNDGSNFAIGVIPYVKVPTNQARLGNRFVEGGIILPANLKLPGAWELGAMTEVDVFHNAARFGYHAVWVNSITLHHDLIPNRLNAYIEYYKAASFERHAGPYDTADVGLLLTLTDNMQLDAGVNLGITRSAPDYNPFIGLSVRF